MNFPGFLRSALLLSQSTVLTVPLLEMRALSTVFALLFAAECMAGRLQAPRATSPVAAAPFFNCPSLEAQAEVLCPFRLVDPTEHNDCMRDVGFTCDLATWMTDVKIAMRSDLDWMTDDDGTAVTLIPAPAPARRNDPPSFASCADMISAGRELTCSTSGDPQLHMWAPGTSGHPQGSGSFVLMKDRASTFEVQICQRPTSDKSEASVGIALAVKFTGPQGSTQVVKNIGGTVWSSTPPGSGAACSATSCAFANGATVSMSGTGVWLTLPPSYCDMVSGLCGSVNPERGGYAGVFTRADGAVVECSPPITLGSPDYGRYQGDFVGTYAVSAADSLFTEFECSATRQWAAPHSPLPPFAGCPGLKDAVLALCPAGIRFAECVIDVGSTCDFARWLGGATPCPYCQVVDNAGCRSDRTDCMVSPWSAWGQCSTTCHEGKRTRIRRVITPARCGGDPCPMLRESALCFQRACGCAKVSCSSGGGGVVRVAHDREERTDARGRQEGHHCKVLAGFTGAWGLCSCRCHTKFRYDYRLVHRPPFDMACGMLPGSECNAARWWEGAATMHLGSVGRHQETSRVLDYLALA